MSSKIFTLPETELVNSWKQEAKQQGKILALLIAGDSASGKTTRANTFDLTKIITSTTRKPRSNEKNGVDYYFVSENDFLKNKDSYLETTNYGFQYYGTKKSEFLDKINRNKNCYLILDINGIINVKNELLLNYADKILVKSIYYKIDKDTFLKRIQKREKNISQEALKVRWNENQTAHTKIQNNTIFDKIIDCNKEIKLFTPFTK